MIAARLGSQEALNHLDGPPHEADSGFPALARVVPVQRTGSISSMS